MVEKELGLKAELSAAEREGIERQVLEDLASHETVQYMRQLEADKVRYGA